MKTDEQRALEQIAVSTSVDNLRARLKNARGKSQVVYRATLDRLARVSAGNVDDPVARACWEMVYTIEEIRRESGRKVWRMHRLRPKIEREGEIAALDYCARNETDGFDEVLGYGLPQLTAEAIVLRYRENFADETLRAARDRLSGAGVDVEAAVIGQKQPQ